MEFLKDWAADIWQQISATDFFDSIGNIGSSVGAIGDFSSLGSFWPYILGLLLILFVVQLFELPFKLVWNGLIGAAMLWLINLVGSLVGFGLKITVFKALVAGFFGIPGAIAVVLFEIFG